MTIRIDGTNTAANPGITGTDTDTGLQFGTDEVNIVTGGSTRVTVNSTGQVGIGTSSPNKPLHINGGSSDAEIRLQTNSGTENNGYVVIRESDGRLDLYSTNGEIRLHPSNTERMRLDTSGNLQFNSGYGSVATAYGCRAWIYMNGTGTISINGDGNVSTIGDNGTGDYTVNFSSNMPDTNYSTVGSCGANPGVAAMFVLIYDSTNSPFFSNPTTSSFRFSTRRDTGAPDDCPRICLAVFR